MSTINERLRQARKAAGFQSARSAAIHFGWKPSTYAAHENGQNALYAETAKMYAVSFKCSITWLVTGTDRLEAGGVIPIVGQVSSKQSVEIRADKGRFYTPAMWDDVDLLQGFAVTELRIDHLYLGFEVRGNGLWPTHAPGDLIVTHVDTGIISTNDEVILLLEDWKGVLAISEDLKCDFDELDRKSIIGTFFDLEGKIHEHERVICGLSIVMVLKRHGWMRVSKEDNSWSTCLNTHREQEARRIAAASMNMERVDT